MIPQLVRHVQRAALARRKVITKRRVDAAHDFAVGVLRLLEQGSSSRAVRDAAKAAYEAQALKLPSSRRRAARLKKAVGLRHAGRTAAQGKPRSQAPRRCSAIAVGNLGDARRDALGDVQGDVPARWRLPHEHERGARRTDLQGREHALGEGLHLRALDDAGRAADRGAGRAQRLPRREARRAGGGEGAGLGLVGARRQAVRRAARLVAGGGGELKEAANKQQRDLSRSLEPMVQEHMRSGYQAANAEAGTGSHRRRVDKLEAHIRKEAPKMFDQAAKEIIGKITELRRDIGAQLDKDVVQASLRALLTAYTPLWDEFGPDCLSTRKRLQPKVRDLLIEISNATRRMAGAGSSASAAAPRPRQPALARAPTTTTTTSSRPPRCTRRSSSRRPST